MFAEVRSSSATVSASCCCSARLRASRLANYPLLSQYAILLRDIVLQFLAETTAIAAIGGLLGCFVVLDPALRKLPRVLTHATRPENLVGTIGDNDPDIRAKSVRVDHD